MKDFLDGSRGEHGRIDWLVDEHEKLERRYQALVDLFISRQVISRNDADQQGVGAART